MFKHIQLLAFALCALLVIPAAAQVPSYVPTDGLVGWWPFNGNANDESGNGNDGVVNGATLTEDRNGAIDAAFSFDGINSLISIAHNTSITVSNNSSLTVQAWALKSGVNSTTHILGKRINGCGSIDYQFGYCEANCNNAFSEGVGFGCASAYAYSQVLLENNMWNHFVGTFNGEEWKIYLNGNMVGSILSNSTNPNIGDLLIGGSGSCQKWEGSIDDIAIYNRALTEQEIQNLYTGQCPTVSTNCTSLPSNLQQGLVGYWPFCGNANDESGNGNDGVVNGATLTEDRFGNANAAYGFDGVDDYIDIDHNDALNLMQYESFTISTWMNTIDTAANTTILSKGAGGGFNSQDEFIFGLDNSHVGLQLSNYPDAYWTYSQDSIAANNWNFVTAVYDATNSSASFYINGTLSSEESYPFQPTSVSDLSSLFIGKQGYACNCNFFHGSLDDIGIWNRALTPEEVQELYTLDACTFTVYDTLTVYETVYDTVYTYETIYDTVTTYVSVTDTLLIDITFTGFEGQPSWLNTVTVFPNPASDHITIDYGNFALMAGYTTVITDAAGATVYSSAVNSQQVEIDINAWGATGVYYMSVYDANGELVAVRHIVLE
jgi:hypothetical protein